MNIALWICQGFIALAFLYSGIMKSTQQREKLVAIGQTGVDGLSYPLIRFIGITEIAGAVGVVLPWLLHIAPALTPLAAAALGTIMIPAAIIHYKRKEMRSVMFNIFLLLLCVFVAYERAAQL